MVNDKLGRTYIEHFSDGTTKDITQEIPFEVPENWAWCRLGEIAYIASGSTPDKNSFVNEGIPYLKMYNLRNQKIDFEYQPQYIKEEVHNGKLQRSKTEIGDLIMNIVGPPLGKLAFIPKHLPKCNFNQAAVLIRSLVSKEIINKYVFIFLSEMSAINSIATKGSAGQDNISLTQTKNILIPLPPLSEQQRIVAKVEELLALVEDLEINKIDLKSYIQQTKSKVLDMAIRGQLVPQNPDDEPASVLLERIKNEQATTKPKSKKTTHNTHYDYDKWLMVNEEVPFEIPKNWAWCRLGEVCEFENGFAFNSNDYKKEEGIPLIRISNIQNGIISLDDVVFIDKKIDEKFIVKKGDLLIAMSGATTGKMGNYTFEEKAYLNQRVGNIRIKNKDILHSKYRDFFMLTKSNDILKMAYGGAQPNISGKIINSLSIPLPPLSEQKRIVQKIEKIFSELNVIEENLT